MQMTWDKHECGPPDAPKVVRFPNRFRNGWLRRHKWFSDPMYVDIDWGELNDCERRWWCFMEVLGIFDEKMMWGWGL